MPDTRPTGSASDDENDKASSANEATSTADAGNDLSDGEKAALATGVADPDSDASLTE